MKPRQSIYPIGKLILEKLEGSGLKLGDFVREIGYGNESKGVRNLDSWCEYGSGHPLFLERLQSSGYAIEPKLLEAALERTRAIIDFERKREEELKRLDEERRFVPYIYAVPERWPVSMSPYCAIGGTRRHSLFLSRDFTSRQATEQLETIEKMVKEHFEKSKGQVPLRRAITHYLFFSAYRVGPLRFETDGTPSGPSDEWVPGEVFVSSVP